MTLFFLFLLLLLLLFLGFVCPVDFWSTGHASLAVVVIFVTFVDNVLFFFYEIFFSLVEHALHDLIVCCSRWRMDCKPLFFPQIFFNFLILWNFVEFVKFVENLFFHCTSLLTLFVDILFIFSS